MISLEAIKYTVVKRGENGSQQSQDLRTYIEEICK